MWPGYFAWRNRAKLWRADSAATVLNTIAIGCFVLGLAPACAGSLGVSPVLLDVAAGDTVSAVRVRNGDATQVARVQARVFRWQQDATGDVLTPTTDVVASPPVTQIQPGNDNLIRVVRTAQHPVQQEESYRLLVDELPTVAAQPGAGGVKFLIRHSIPVFFAPKDTVPAQVQWRITRTKEGGWQIHAHNTGGKRVRIVDLALYDAHDTLVAQRTGLVGYVLGQSHVDLFLPASGIAGHTAQALRLTMRGETNTIETGLLPIGSP